jgi:hypothetical protein
MNRIATQVSLKLLNMLSLKPLSALAACGNHLAEKALNHIREGTCFPSFRFLND